MKTHVDIAHPRLFALRKTQLAKMQQLLIQIILDRKGRKGLGLLVLQLPFILGPQTFTKIMMRHDKCLLRIW